jgi:hypothetical protein
MKLKHLRDAMERINDVDGEADVVFAHGQPEILEDIINVNIMDVAGVMINNNVVFLITNEFGSAMNKYAHGEKGIKNITFDKDIGMYGVKFTPSESARPEERPGQAESPE